jgi:hypothetical protein
MRARFGSAAAFLVRATFFFPQWRGRATFFPQWRGRTDAMAAPFGKFRALVPQECTQTYAHMHARHAATCMHALPEVVAADHRLDTCHADWSAAVRLARGESATLALPTRPARPDSRARRLSVRSAAQARFQVWCPRCRAGADRCVRLGAACSCVLACFIQSRSDRICLRLYPVLPARCVDLNSPLQ